ncbi:fe907f80-6116-4bdc-a69b-50a96b037180 [Thermothielavioides terrestris]|uniref:Fe907f80-6116-4bdc-a69b-50a96b037180 n=1 Tax=Thermothielavioides terrestris TaxID=2587410 RepID=A0A3S4F5A2_9PEZI|nr:fe907f80-6116-4bdc-a69b-50a96b037180 [Thermothielavioides terrestris]
MSPKRKTRGSEL